MLVRSVMRILIYLFVITMFLSSCNQDFIPCKSSLPMTEQSPVYLPLKLGNEWVYLPKSFESKYDTSVYEKRVVIITSIQE